MSDFEILFEAVFWPSYALGVLSGFALFYFLGSIYGYLHSSDTN